MITFIILMKRTQNTEHFFFVDAANWLLRCCLVLLLFSRTKMRWNFSIASRCVVFGSRAAAYQQIHLDNFYFSKISRKENSERDKAERGKIQIHVGGVWVRLEWLKDGSRHSLWLPSAALESHSLLGSSQFTHCLWSCVFEAGKLNKFIELRGFDSERRERERKAQHSPFQSEDKRAFGWRLILISLQSSIMAKSCKRNNNMTKI